MRIMHGMSSVILKFPGTAVIAPSDLRGVAGPDVEGSEGRARQARRRASVQEQIGVMRARGMSHTGIRRALGLSEREAVDAGVIPGRADAERDDGGRPPADAPPGRRGDECPGPPPGGRGGPKMADVLAAVARAGKVSQEDIAGASQGRRLTPLRQLTMSLLRELCEGASLPAIGHFLGRDHTTVHYGCRKAAKRLRSEPDFRRLYDDVRAALAPLTASDDG